MEMKSWRVVLTAPPSVLRHCKKCGVKTPFESSGFFRVNAQQKLLDIWLIYKCIYCACTWNMTVRSRVNPHTLPRENLDMFHRNDPDLAMRCAFDSALLQRNKCETVPPPYRIEGDDIPLGIPARLSLTSDYPCDLKVCVLLREKLGLSRSAFDRLVELGQVRITTGNITKETLNKPVVIEFQPSV